MRIRPLSTDDQQRLWRWLHIALWDPPPAALRPKEVLDSPRVRIYAENWGGDGDLGVVGEIGGKPVGACWMRVLPDGVGLAFVDARTPQLGIAVEPAHQHRGHGRALMVAALAAARERRFERVSLTVHPQNPAIRMYEQCGFEKREIRNGYHMMVADLAPSRVAPARCRPPGMG
jgi:ribosomal protein S18 acetylase RimI-like enzyme